jgi:alcohol dehydrogenase (cytochrome c)
MRAQQASRRYVPVTDEMLQKPAPADWLMWRRTLDGWGYSPLNQINRNNVAQLRLVWTRGMAAGNTQESTPLVYDGVMYLPNSGDYIQALDAQTGDMIWDYQRQLTGNARRQNRNIAIYGNTIIDTSADNAVYALDAQTGKLAWQTQILDPTKPANASSGPIIAKGKVISGRQCHGAGHGAASSRRTTRRPVKVWHNTVPRPAGQR